MSIKHLFVLGWFVLGLAIVTAAVGVAFNPQPVLAGNSDGDKK